MTLLVADNKVPVWLRVIEPAHSGAVNNVLFCYNDTRLLTCSEDKTIALWDAESLEPLSTYAKHDGEVSGCTNISHSTNQFCSVGWDKLLLTWDAERTEALWSVKHDSLPTGCSLSRGGEVAAVSCDRSHSVVLWDINSATQIAELQGHSNSVMSCHIQPENNLVCSASLDHTTAVWDLRMRRVLLRLRRHINGVSTCQLSPSGRFVCTGSWDRMVCLWDIMTGSYRHDGPVELKLHDSCVSCCRFSADGNFVASSGFDGLLAVWDCRQRTLHYRFKVDQFDIQTWILGCDISDNQRHIVTALKDGSVKLWNIKDFDEPLFVPDMRKKMGLLTQNCAECQREFSIPQLSSAGSRRPTFEYPDLCVMCRMEKPSRSYNIA